MKQEKTHATNPGPIEAKVPQGVKVVPEKVVYRSPEGRTYPDSRGRGDWKETSDASVRGKGNIEGPYSPGERGEGDWDGLGL